MSGGYLIYERRYGRIGFWWDWAVWGLGLTFSVLHDDWIEHNQFMSYSLEFALGPFDLGFSLYWPPGKKRAKGWMR